MKAITREEKIMSGENLTPITRKEMFLAKASGMDIETPTPITREEIFLSKISGGGGTSGATAYTVSSVDELPSNAVDGSMAIVPSDSIVGTWVFNETLNFDHIKLPNNGDWLRVECCGYSNLTNNFDGFTFRNDGGSIIFQAMRDIFNEESDIYDLYYDGMWDDQMPPFEIYRFDEVATLNNEGTSMPEGYGSTKEDFIAWLKANANRISGGYSLYTHENGQWVYKGEVV